MKIPVILLCLVLCLSAQAAITVNGLKDKSRYDDTVTFTIVAEVGYETTAPWTDSP